MYKYEFNSDVKIETPLLTMKNMKLEKILFHSFRSYAIRLERYYRDRKRMVAASDGSSKLAFREQITMIRFLRALNYEVVARYRPTLELYYGSKHAARVMKLELAAGYDIYYMFTNIRGVIRSDIHECSKYNNYEMALALIAAGLNFERILLAENEIKDAGLQGEITQSPLDKLTKYETRYVDLLMEAGAPPPFWQARSFYEGEIIRLSTQYIQRD